MQLLPVSISSKDLKACAALYYLPGLFLSVCMCTRRKATFFPREYAESWPGLVLKSYAFFLSFFFFPKSKRLWEKKKSLVFSLAIPNSDFGRASQMEKQMLQICLIYGATVDSVVQILIYICMKGFRD